MNKYNLESLKKDFFILLILAKTNGGKTHMVLNSIWPAVREKYDNVMVFTKFYCFKQYEEGMKTKGCRVTCIDVLKLMKEKKGIEHALDFIINMLEGQLIGYTKETHLAKFKWNTLLIFDDCIDEDVVKSKQMKIFFASIRHYQASIIFLSQYTRVIVSRMMIANTSHMVIGRFTGDCRSDIIKYIRECLVYKNKNDGVEEAEKIYKKCVENTDWGKILIFENNLYTL